ncbi:MAG: hypothetical protein A3E36_01355 [Candidatus Andersenbacteria bacterium RIFCSPHIGHO2_12_FULL_45_11b]|uniref:Uncharacterized protein n=1 Tax=Candidatus Andersenbacteria bacterium RIFCSPHIGHO2_12_FULL_45_11b TaxID=1797282 RepID=A0A1G1XAX6_9BACT|nr:MAG: hypothetical protein A3E36_01355 [Candidatus Andersenbacteria bacterium RIFCSPHIGHO2_12_FULL_45_11b]
MNTKLAVIIGTVAIIFISGVWFAFQLPQNVPPKTDTAYTGPVFIDLRVGTVVRESFASQKNPPIKQKSDYSTKDLLMLQGTTADGVTSPVTVTVRLRDAAQSIIPLVPESVTLDPGKNEYCCWNIPTVGNYTMQVLRPDGIITNLPIKIIPAAGQ